MSKKRKKSRGLKKNPKRRAKAKSNPKRRRKHAVKANPKRRRRKAVKANPKRRRRHAVKMNPIRSRRRRHAVKNPSRRRKYHRNPGYMDKVKGVFKGENVMGLGHKGGDLAGLLVGGMAYGFVTGAAVKYLGFILTPIQTALGKGGAKVVTVLGPAVPALLLGIPAHILAKKFASKMPIALSITRGLLAAVVVGVGASAARTLMPVTAASAAVKGLPQLRGYMNGYDFTPGSMAGGSSFVNGPSKADFGSLPEAQVSSADFGGMGRYVSAGEAEAMGGYDTRSDFGASEDYDGGIA